MPLKQNTLSPQTAHTPWRRFVTVCMAVTVLFSTLSILTSPTWAAMSSRSTDKVAYSGAPDGSAPMQQIAATDYLSQTVSGDRRSAELEFGAAYNVPQNFQQDIIDSTGVYHLLADGTVVVAGQTYEGEEYSYYPTRVPAGEAETFGDCMYIDGNPCLANVTMLNSGYFLTSTGRVYYIGANTNGEAGRGGNATDVHTKPVRVRAGEAANTDIAHTENGVSTDVEWVDGVDYLCNISAISGGFALTEQGALYVWGSNYYGRLGIGLDTGTNNGYNPLPVRVQAGEAYGTYGNPSGKDYEEKTAGRYLHNIAYVRGSSNGAFAVTKEGRLYGWGSNGSNQITPELTRDSTSYITTVRRICVPSNLQVSGGIHNAAAYTETLGGKVFWKSIDDISTASFNIRVQLDGRLYCWGFGRGRYGGGHGSLTPGTAAVFNGYYMRAGDAAYDGNSLTANNPESALTNVEMMWSSGGSTIVITTDGKVYTCGTGANVTGSVTSVEETDNLIRVWAGDAVSYGSEYYYTVSGDAQKYLKMPYAASVLPIERRYGSFGRPHFFIEGDILLPSDWREESVGTNKTQKPIYEIQRDINDILPLATMTICKIDSPESGNVESTLAFDAYYAGKSADKTIMAETDENGWYRAYYKLYGNTIWYIDIEVDNILENDIDGSVEPDDLYNGIDVDYPTDYKQAYVTLTSNLIATRLADVAAGNGSSYLLAADSSVFSMGSNTYGQLGRTGVTNPEKPGRVLAGQAAEDGSGNYIEIGGVKYLYGIVSVHAQGEHVVALDKQGRVYAWGRNDRGQLGDGSNQNRSTPVRMRAGEAIDFAYSEAVTGAIAGNYLINVVDVGLGPNNSGLICQAPDETARRLYVTGSNDYGQLGIGSRVNQNAPVRVLAGLIGEVSPFLSTAYYDNANTTREELTGGKKAPIAVKQVAFGDNHMLVLNTTGRLFAAGDNRVGQLGQHNASVEGTGTIALDGGTYSTILVAVVGQEACMYYGSYAALNSIFPNSYNTYRYATVINVRYISAFGNSSMAVILYGGVVGWGENTKGQLGTGTNTNVTDGPMGVLPVSGAVDGEESYIFTSYMEGGGTKTLSIGIEKVHMGDGYTIFVRDDGRFMASGENAQGRMAAGVAQTNRVVWCQLGGLAQAGENSTDTLQGARYFDVGSNHTIGWFQRSDGSRMVAGFGSNAGGALGAAPGATPSYAQPSVAPDSTVATHVYNAIDIRYKLYSHVQEFGVTGGRITMLIESGSFGSTVSDHALWQQAQGQTANGYLDRTFTVYENGKYEAVYYMNSQKIWSGDVVIEGLDFIDLSGVATGGFTVPSALDYTFYLRGVYRNHNRPFDETLTLYGPQSVSPADEWDYGAVVKKILPAEIEQMYNTKGDGFLERVTGTQSVNTTGVYTAVITREVVDIDGNTRVKLIGQKEVHLYAILHVKQVVIQPDDSLSVPNTGYVQVDNYEGGGANVLATYNKQIESGLTSDYTTMNLPIRVDSLRFGIRPVVPGYYEIDRVEIGTAENGQSVVSDYTVDFTSTFEYWVTVYVKPSTSDIRPYHWDYQTNGFRVR